jgi:hypothetical protein
MEITGFLQAKNYRKGGNLPVNRLTVRSGVSNVVRGRSCL